MIIEERIEINASPERIFSIYADVERWNVWDPDTKSSCLIGPFQTGSKVRLEPTVGRAIWTVLTEVSPNRNFTVEGGIPFFKMTFDHELTLLPESTGVVHRVTFSGPLAFLLGRVIGARVREGLPKTLARLKRLAETGRVD